jgi:putative phosphoesterase
MRHELEFLRSHSGKESLPYLRSNLSHFALTRIGLLSDTHGYLDENILFHLASCDEIWHAGDWGNASVHDLLKKNIPDKPIRGVYGNIDGQDIRSLFPETNIFSCEQIKVFMTHIGGYPPNKYVKGIKEEIIRHKAGLFICGHSHILKVMYDENLNCLHMNPGAAGKQGWQKVRTLIRFVIHDKDIRDCNVIELP